MTKVKAIKKLMEDNEGLASWSLIYNKLMDYYPNLKKSREWKAGIRGVLYRDIGKTFKKIDDGLFSLIDFSENMYLKNKYNVSTEGVSTIKTRIGQTFFRQSLIKNLKKCPFTKITYDKLLIASHIKPWAISNDLERLDMKNGFVFTPTYDKLFDKGYISFKNNKSLLVSSRLDKNTKKLLSLDSGNIISNLIVSGRKRYLEYHRDEIFI